MIETIVAIILGIFFGIITGLIPGLHTNLVSSILVAILPAMLNYITPFTAMIFIICLTITNIFFEFIPAIYLGAPEEDTNLSVMPGHELLLNGKGHEAVQLMSTGAKLGIFASFIMTFIFILFLKATYPFFERMMFWILCWICIFIITGEKNKIISLIFFILSGFLGIGALNNSVNQPLLPLLTGLFGISGLIESVNQKTKIPHQDTNLIKIKTIDVIPSTISSLAVSPLCSFLPGLGSSQATIIGTKIQKLDRKQFLILNGTINSLIMYLSFVTLYLIERSRTGSAAAISSIIQISLKELTIVFVLFLIIGLGTSKLTLFTSKFIANKINKVNYSKISISVIIFLITMTIIISGLMGILVLLTSTLLGLVCQKYNVRKGILMGCLLIPTLLIYLPI